MRKSITIFLICLYYGVKDFIKTKFFLPKKVKVLRHPEADFDCGSNAK